jgi:pilus assembly protein CpaF
MTDVDLVADVHRRLVDAGGGLADIGRLIAGRAPLLTSAERDHVGRQVAARFAGLGPIQHLFEDPDVSEIMINGPGPVWVERRGAIEAAGIELDRAALELLVERIVAPIGRQVDPLRPWVDGRLGDGSRVNIVGRPVALDGPYITIRRFTLRRPALAAFGSPAMAAALAGLVEAGATIVVSGGTGSGKTSLLNALAGRLPTRCRVVTVEDAAELDLPLPHVVRLECRPPGTEGVGQVDVRDLVRTALRMRPDRLILGEVRGPEAFDLMQAFNTGHRGGMSTVHANSPVDALRRLATLVLAAGTAVPASVVADQLAAAIDVVVQVARTDGVAREVVDIARVVGPADVASMDVEP